MVSFDYLKEVVEKSVEKNGDKPLTTEWLLNMIKLAEKNEYLDSIAAECSADVHW